MTFLKKGTVNVSENSNHSKSNSAPSAKSAAGYTLKTHNRISSDYAKNRHSTNDLRSSMAFTGSKLNYDSQHHSSEKTPLGSLSDQLEVHTLTDSYSADNIPNSPSMAASSSSTLNISSTKPSQRNSNAYGGEFSTQSSSRKSSGNSINSLSFDKLILSWDPTDPDEWNMQRIVSWLKFHEFPDTWISTFKKQRLVGQNFIKLLAYENFAVYEKYLPQSKTASYKKFQTLLKQTMTKNVANSNHNNGHNRVRSSDKLKSSRSSSESIKNKTKEEIDNTSRSASESMMSPIKTAPTKTEDKSKHPQLRTHQKTKSASVLYRKSFISLRGSLTPSTPTPNNNNQQGSNQQTNATSNIKLKIPSRPSSIIESTASSSKSNTPPLSPSSYPNIFRRNHKSSSSESSLLNAIFGTSHNNSSNSNLPVTNKNGSGVSPNTNKIHNTITKPRSIESPSDSYKRKSFDAASKLRMNHESSSLSPTKSNAQEEKSNLWGKLKRRSQFSSPYSSSALPTPVAPSRSSSVITLTPGKVNHDVQSPSVSSMSSKLSKKQTLASETLTDSPIVTLAKDDEKENSSKEPVLSVDPKYFPGNSLTDEDRETYILITKDNKSYIPFQISLFNSPETFKDTICTRLNISAKQMCVHMTNFKGDIGSPLTDDIISMLVNNSFKGSTLQFYIKDHSKIQNRLRTGTLSSDIQHTLRSVKSKGSVRSVTSSIHGTTDDVSIVTSSSDITSSEDHSPSNNFRRYPQTPSYYYDNAVLNNSGSEETNYWNVKEQVPDELPAPIMTSKPAQKFNLHLPDKKRTGNLQADSDNKSSFNVLRKDDTGEIDFNKRRESPYIDSELAPKRNAPKAPSNVSPPRNVSLSSHTNLKPTLRRTSTKRKMKNMTRPIPNGVTKAPVETTSPVSDTIVSSYTPASTQVLVPQPYKGASDITRKKKTEEEYHNPALSYINKQNLNRSSSVVSASNSIFSSPSPGLLKRGSSRRIVSSASAADVFVENDITFADAPPLSDTDSNKDENSYNSDSSDDIIWSNASDKRNEFSPEKTQTQDKADSDVVLVTPTTGKDVLVRKMTLRPSPEVVYQNLEKFFPSANLDKPVVEGGLTPTSPISMRQSFQVSQSSSSNTPQNNPFKQPESDSQNEPPSSGNMRRLKTPKRAKTIRTIAHEASEKRKQSMKIKRQNTKMWGTKVVEITDKQAVAINKAKNSKGEYKEFAWIKGEKIGKGSFGAVYLSLNVTTGEMMAVKQVEVPKYSSQDENIMNMVEALEFEVSTLKDLDHPNIVQYLGFEVKDDIYSLFLEYVAGGSVGSLIRMYGRFDEPLIQYLTFQVLEGLSYLHSRGILHRDMKADNVLLDQDGICKISDFGISKKSKDIYSNSDMTMRGTVFWMAPEMVDTKQGYSAKVDIWALGCVVLEMFAGKRPWSNLEVVAAMFKIGKSKSAPPIPDDTLPLISGAGRQFLDACFEIDPEKRPTADDLLSHPFLKDSNKYVFDSTELYEFIKSNDKINSTKLRISSHEGIKDNNM
ncbi:similar to Saccharomyces cerevisiae YJL095W BCK1 Mitogen-activated protein (MAP) kinase kinase kinase acting in the protein kinase C signaling pathway, which controls cell integrity [Maudiozyma saulgeensis]|uniref:Similar to Saccharomyces cerevisiae YJL095W BCK1 Mitogen-activated protein (MAP) kinase kinase kinase acting in the protein kinase C signaling pathway, which controls cell integrity n=1 Tax=Maudiozyma saulgeensis TaxID=1789683 RepID=A0A1X7R8E4_9SACH|nr:similar to Saccharomyces cerevisiae YJL095W BCK1 Mitogen-activated protein (MAP) kinase kinase kinase acting in the protein kinase C signaling pathway, which controls cell integrity [Kazachstania saulgeensis]